MSESTGREKDRSVDESGNILIGKRYQVHPDRPLPEYDSPSAKAFTATDTRGSKRSVMAYVCPELKGIRMAPVASLMRVPQIPALLPLDIAISYWPQIDAKRPVLITPYMGGSRVGPVDGGTFEAWSEDQVTRCVLRSLLPALRELGDRNLTHRGIRADNLFSSDQDDGDAYLGECITALPGLHQPAIYEPIDSAMSLPAGRGEGQPADDFYALGVLCVVLLSGGNPVAHLSDQEVTAAKIEQGSYGALAGQSRTSMSMAELLRGLLADSEADRWQSEELSAWLDGRHRSPGQSGQIARAARALEFAGGEYITAPALSFALGCHWTEAVELARTKEIETWVRRSLLDEEKSEAIKYVLEAGRSSGAGAAGDDLMVSKVLLSLDPQAPVRLKDVSARVSGVAGILAEDFDNESRRGLVHLIIGTRLPQKWIESQERVSADNLALQRIMDRASQDLKYGSVYAIHRVLYQLNPDWPCQSPLLQKQFVTQLIELLPALDEIAAEVGPDDEPADPHLVAFVAAHHQMVSESSLKAIAQRNSVTSRRLAVLGLLADVQVHLRQGAFPGLAGWMARLLSSCMEGFHNRATREAMVKVVQEVAKSGDLARLRATIENPQLREQDRLGFAAAQQEFARCASEISWLKDGGLLEPENVKEGARRAASAVASCLAGTCLVIMALAYAF